MIDIDAVVAEVQELMFDQYGVFHTVYLEDGLVERLAANGEDPQAIVDHLGEKYGLERIDKPQVLGGPLLHETGIDN